MMTVGKLLVLQSMRKCFTHLFCHFGAALFHSNCLLSERAVSSHLDLKLVAGQDLGDTIYSTLFFFFFFLNTNQRCHWYCDVLFCSVKIVGHHEGGWQVFQRVRFRVLLHYRFDWSKTLYICIIQNGSCL